MLGLQKRQVALAYQMNAIEIPSVDFGRQRQFAKNAMLLTLIAIAIVAVVPLGIYAADDEILTVFSSKAFQGSMEVVQSMNFLGKIMNFIISVFCLIGLFLVMYSRIVTLLYLSSRNVWDRVNEVKTHMNGSFFGFPELGKYVWNGSDSGGGIDSFVSFFYGLLPNIKKSSDYDDSMKSNLKLEDTDNALDYILKVGPSTILIMFFLSIGFSGTLSQAYGKIVSAMVTVADNFIAINFDGYIDSLFKLGDAPSFTVGDDGTEQGSLTESVAKKIYAYTAAACGIEDTTARSNLAATCETIARNHVTAGTVSGLVGIDLADDSDWSRVKVSIKKSSGSQGSSTTDVISIQEIYPSYEGELYFHVTYSAGSESENYFTSGDN